MEYEWDEEKNQANIEKHGIEFNQAIAIFDGLIVEIPDTRYDYGEERFLVLGLLEDIVLTVVCTTRGEKTRLISARVASRKERERYYEEIKTEDS